MTNEIMVKMVLDAWNKQVSDANKLFDSLSDEQMKMHADFLDKPDRAVADLPSVSELRKCWTSSCEELAKHFKNETPEGWFGKHASVSAEDFAKEPHRNKLNVLLSRTGHLQNHLGQMVFLKSKG